MLTNRKAVICVLAAVLMILLAIPVFASGGTEDADTQDGETVEQAEQTEEITDAEDNESTEPSEGDETEDGDGDAKEDETPAEETGEETDDTGDTGDSTPAETREAPAKAASGLPANNTKVNYTSAGSHPVKFTVKAEGHKFKGTCATLGVDNASSGKATVKRISNNSRIAKLVYYYGYKKGWWQGKNSSKKATTVMDFSDSNCTENAKQCIEALIQRDNMGWSDFWAARKVNGYRMYSTDSFMREINDLYKNTDISKISIPDDVVFEMFHGVTSSSKVQDFYVWRYKEIPTSTNGFVAVEKVSGNVSITE